jgi:single-strand DNA-binding protein
MFNKVILIGRLGQNAEAKTAQNNREYVVLSIATHESWKNDKGDYETRTEWHRVYAWRNSPSSPRLSRRDSSSPWKAPCGIAK